MRAGKGSRMRESVRRSLAVILLCMMTKSRDIFVVRVIHSRKRNFTRHAMKKNPCHHGLYALCATTVVRLRSLILLSKLTVVLTANKPQV